MTVASLKSRLRAGDRVLGALVRMPAEELFEMAAVAGMDFLLIDGEHGPADQTALRAHIALAQLHGVSVLVRVGQHEPALIQRALDLGATGIVVPHVDSAEQASAVVKQTRYPPVGDRGFATYGRAGRFGTVSAADHLRADDETTLTFVMIESPTGCANAEAILGVPGVDGMMCGPADLAAAMGAEPGAPQVRATIDELHAVAAESGTSRMDIVPDRARAEAAFATGAQLVALNLTHLLMAMFADVVRARP